MKKNKYFLVVRDTSKDEFQIISVHDHWGSSLEEIDLFTTAYKDKEELLKSNHCFIENADLFIVNQDNSHIYIQEVLFQDMKNVCTLVNASFNGTLEKEGDFIHRLLNAFCRKMKEDQSFYRKVIYGETALYPKFVRYFLDKRFVDIYSVKYKDGCWIQKSYPLLRNIMWSLFHMMNYHNQREERLKGENKLLMMTADHYHPSQPSLFDFINDDAFLQVLEEKDSEVEYGYQKCKRNGRVK